MMGPATVAFSAGHEELSKLQERLEVAIGRRDYGAQADIRNKIATHGAKLEELHHAAAREQEDQRAAEWGRRERETLAEVAVLDNELADAHERAAAALAGLVEVAERRSGRIEAHVSDPSRPADGSPFRAERTTAGGVRLVELAAGDLLLALAADALARCSGSPWSDLVQRIRGVAQRIQLPPRTPKETR